MKLKELGDMDGSIKASITLCSYCAKAYSNAMGPTNTLSNVNQSC